MLVRDGYSEPWSASPDQNVAMKRNLNSRNGMTQRWISACRNCGLIKSKGRKWSFGRGTRQEKGNAPQIQRLADYKARTLRNRPVSL